MAITFPWATLFYLSAGPLCRQLGQSPVINTTSGLSPLSLPISLPSTPPHDLYIGFRRPERLEPWLTRLISPTNADSPSISPLRVLLNLKF